MSATAFTMTRMVQFAETDLAGVLHFANYHRYMEEVEHAFWRQQGASVVLQEGARTVSWPRVAVSCEYFAPLHFEDEVELGLTVVNVGERAVTFQVEFRRGEDLVACGRMTAVCCTMQEGTFRAISIPDDLRSRLHAIAVAATR